MRRWAFFFMILLAPIWLGAEKILLRTGKAVYGKIIERTDDWIVVSGRLGELKIPLSRVLSITDEVEPPPPKEEPRNFSEPYRDIEREMFRISFSWGRWKWQGGDLKNYAEKAYSYWNTVGEIEHYLGADVQKVFGPPPLGMSTFFDLRVQKRIGIWQVGFSYAHYENSFELETHINEATFLDDWKLRGNRLSLIAGMAQVAPSQAYALIEIGGNFVNFTSRTEESRVKTDSFFISLAPTTGYILDLSPSLSIYGEVGYVFALKPSLGKVFLSNKEDKVHKSLRPVFNMEQGIRPHLKLGGPAFAAGVVLKLLRPSRGLRTTQ